MTELSNSPAPNADTVIGETRRWLEDFVIGLNLCPFAEKPYKAGKVRLRVSRAVRPELLRDDLLQELDLLAGESTADLETTLLIHPGVLQRFVDFNGFLDVVDDCLKEKGLEGLIQVASFHPEYQFLGSQVGDVSNASNRSPYPMLHLLREESVSEALDRYLGDPREIPRRNVRLLDELGWDGVAAALTRSRRVL